MSTASLAFGPPESQAQFRRLVAAELLKLRKRRPLLVAAKALIAVPMLVSVIALGLSAGTFDMAQIGESSSTWISPRISSS